MLSLCLCECGPHSPIATPPRDVTGKNVLIYFAEKNYQISLYNNSCNCKRVNSCIKSGSTSETRSHQTKGFCGTTYICVKLFQTFIPCFRWFQIVCEWLQKVFEVVVDGCRWLLNFLRWLWVVLGGSRSFHVLVTTSAHLE